MSSPLHTLIAPAELSQDIRKSRFLAQAARVFDADEALRFVQQVSDTAATHNCWAYRIGQDYRFNDDGEPGGTAGRPILQAIEGQGFDQCVVVVTRWYGGIKLGAGGLARAYGGCAAECLRLAPREPLIAMLRFGLHCDFAELALFNARLRELGAVIESEQFTATGATLQLRIAASEAPLLRERVTDLSRGRSEVFALD